MFKTFKVFSPIIGAILMFKLGGPTALGVILTLCFVGDVLRASFPPKPSGINKDISLTFSDMVESSLVLASSFFVFNLGGPVVLGILLAATSGTSILFDTVILKGRIDIESNKANALNNVHAAPLTNSVTIRPDLQPARTDFQRNIETSVHVAIQTDTQPNIPRENHDTNGINIT